MDLAFSALGTLTGIWTLKNGHVLGCFFGYWPLLIMDLAFSALGTLTENGTLKNGHVLGCFFGYWLNLGTYGDHMGPYGTKWARPKWDQMGNRGPNGPGPNGTKWAIWDQTGPAQMEPNGQ